MSNLTDNGTTFDALICTTTVDSKPTLKLLAAFNTVLSITATMGNILILIALQKESSLHSPAKLLLRCLTVTDLCVGIIGQPLFSLVLIFVVNDSKELCPPILGFSFLLGIIFFGVSLLTLTAVSVDRLFALLLGMRFRQIVTFRRTLAILVFFWILNVTIAVLSSWNYFVFLWYGSVLILSCLLTSVLSYVKIYATLRRQQNVIQDLCLHGNHGHQNTEQAPLNIARYKRTVFGTLWIQFALVCCYLPHWVVTALSTFTGLTPSIVLGWRFTTTVVYMNSSLNPFLYCWKIKEVRQAVKDTIRQCCCLSR